MLRYVMLAYRERDCAERIVEKNSATLSADIGRTTGTNSHYSYANVQNEDTNLRAIALVPCQPGIAMYKYDLRLIG